jgi:GNAT superfamily N-acetyltransferase
MPVESTPLLRVATRADIPGIQRVRRAVRENRLVSRVIGDDEVVDAIERTGRGWVVEDDGEIVGFSIGNGETGNVWALFVDPAHEGRGHGRRLHDAMLAWLWSRGLGRLWLTTDRGTRAEGFYERAGWVRREVNEAGEVLFEQLRPPA